MRKSILSKLPYLILAFMVGILAAIIEGYITIYMMKVVDTALLGNKSLFISQARILVILAIALLPVNVILSMFKGLYKYKSLVSAKNKFMLGVFNKDISEFQKDNIGKYMSNITQDMGVIENNFVEAIFQIGINLIYFLVGVIVIASVNPLALGIGLGISVVSTLIAMALSKPLQRHQSQRSKLFEDYTSYIKEVLSAFQIIKSYNLRDKIEKDFYEKSKEIQHKGFIIDKIYTYFLSIQSFTMNLSFYGIAGIVVLMSLQGLITVGGVILIIQNMEKIINPLMQFSEWLPKIFSVKTIFEDMDESLKNHKYYEETFELESFVNDIQFIDVSFGYDDKLILKNVNISLDKGKKYLVVGPSGGGKSTFLKLLRKYYNPLSGNILIDNIDLKDIQKISYFKKISNIEQQVFLFEDTIRNNITLYKNYSDEEINIAIEKAGLKEFISNLPNGLDYFVYDNGKNISGGEKSRIAIARGLLAESDIIFLDEAFASLDAKIAKEIEKTLLELSGITVVNVSHVIFDETKDRYDEVISISNGQLVKY